MERPASSSKIGTKKVDPKLSMMSPSGVPPKSKERAMK
jgi:hypothetical protein